MESPWLPPLLPRALEPALFWPVYYLLTWQILLDQPWQWWPCRTHVPTDASTVVRRVLTVVCASTVTSWEIPHTLTEVLWSGKIRDLARWAGVPPPSSGASRAEAVSLDRAHLFHWTSSVGLHTCLSPTSFWVCSPWFPPYLLFQEAHHEHVLQWAFFFFHQR